VSFAEAEQDKAWRSTMQDEIKSIEDNHTWEIIELPHGHHAIGLH
jgi:hypothetical protein